ncbi:MAG: glycosyltransferase family 2 protein [Deltaproteobacteria bacterium]|jgi:glycosyltransferase involved in cell wall biosynthesis|nr:glycosyltransferase family 2 protein [Deltaproteobacteria bacterium]
MRNTAWVPFDCSVRVLDAPSGRAQKPFSLYAVLFAWYEEDIIAACVKNLFAEGVERVFLIDNGSPDRTVELAVQGGALYVETVVSERFSEEIKCGSVFALTRRILAGEGRERSWWLFCDADEFPTSPDRGSIRAWPAGLDDAIRVVGGHVITHWPLEKPHYLSGFHPADFQFRATPHDDVAVYCNFAHNRHNLTRFDNGVFDVTIYGGDHHFTADAALYEADKGLCVHHFQFRNEGHSPGRLKALVGVDENGCSRLGDAAHNEKLRNKLGLPSGLVRGTPGESAQFVQ